MVKLKKKWFHNFSKDPILFCLTFHSKQGGYYSLCIYFLGRVGPPSECDLNPLPDLLRGWVGHGWGVGWALEVQTMIMQEITQYVKIHVLKDCLNYLIS